MESGPRATWVLGDPVEVPPARTADLHFSQTCFGAAVRAWSLAAGEQVLTDPGFLWLTPILHGLDGIPVILAWS